MVVVIGLGVSVEGLEGFEGLETGFTSMSSKSSSRVFCGSDKDSSGILCEFRLGLSRDFFIVFSNGYFPRLHLKH